MGAVHYVAYLIEFWVGFKFFSPNLSLRVEGFNILLVFTPEYTGFLWLSVEEEADIYIAVFAWGVPSSSHLLNMDMDKSGLLLFQVNPRTGFCGSLDWMMLKVNGMGVDTSTPSWYAIHTGPQDFPELFLEVDNIIFNVSNIIWWKITIIQSWISVGTF